MKHDDKNGKVPASLEKIAHYNVFLAEALFELLARRGYLTVLKSRSEYRNLWQKQSFRFPQCSR